MISSMLEEPATVKPEGPEEQGWWCQYPEGDPEPPLTGAAENDNLGMMWMGRGGGVR